MGKLPKCSKGTAYTTLFFTVERPAGSDRKAIKDKLKKVVMECKYSKNIDFASVAAEEGEVEDYPHTHLVVHLKQRAKVDQFPEILQKAMHFDKGKHTFNTVQKALDKNPESKVKVGDPIKISVWMGYLPNGTVDKTLVMTNYLTVKKHKSSHVDPDGMMTFIDTTCCTYCGTHQVGNYLVETESFRGVSEFNEVEMFKCHPHPKYLALGRRVCHMHPNPAICLF